MSCVAAFGEVMLRLCPPGKKRFAQSFPGSIEATFGGGEANVCASIAMLGGCSRYLTALPDNPVARAFAAQLRGMGCDVSKIHFDKLGRMGVYYAEHGSNMRGSNVVYDRDGSTISLLPPEAYDFAAMLDGVTHLHVTGITPALSSNAYLSTLAAVKFASENGITVSVDLNYRKKLWNWEAGTAKNILDSPISLSAMKKMPPMFSVFTRQIPPSMQEFSTSPVTKRSQLHCHSDSPRQSSSLSLCVKASLPITTTGAVCSMIVLPQLPISLRSTPTAIMLPTRSKISLTASAAATLSAPDLSMRSTVKNILRLPMPSVSRSLPVR